VDHGGRRGGAVHVRVVVAVRVSVAVLNVAAALQVTHGDQLN
jgi:hypothetical protein